MEIQGLATNIGRHVLGFPGSFWTIYKKDSKLEMRSPAGLVSAFVFSLIISVIFHYAMGESVFLESRNLWGVLLSTMFFASTMASGRNTHFEKEGGALRVLLLSPLDSAGYFLGKVASLWQLLILFILCFLPIHSILLTGRVPALDLAVLSLFASLVCAALSLSALGILLGYVVLSNRLKDMLLPLLLLPASLPVFMLCVDAFSGFAVGEGNWGSVVLVGIPGLMYCALGSLAYYTLTADE